MANKKISQLNPAATLTGAEEVPVVQAGVTVKATTQAIADLAGTSTTLQEVLTAGNLASSSMLITGSAKGDIALNGNDPVGSQPALRIRTATLTENHLVTISGSIFNNNGNQLEVITPVLDANYVVTYPKAFGTLVTSVNGNSANANGNASSFPFTGSARITGSLGVTGSITAMGSVGITGTYETYTPGNIGRVIIQPVDTDAMDNFGDPYATVTSQDDVAVNRHKLTPVGLVYINDEDARTKLTYQPGVASTTTELTIPAQNGTLATTQDIDTKVPYSVYTATLTQTGTNAPVATVLQNTIGNIVWSYVGVGSYNATLTGAFPAGKVFFYAASVANYNSGPQIYTSKTRDFSRVTDNIVNLSQTELIFTAGVYTSAGTTNTMSDVSIEIRVYP